MHNVCCPRCGATFKLAKPVANARMKCAHCGHIFVGTTGESHSISAAPAAPMAAPSPAPAMPASPARVAPAGPPPPGSEPPPPPEAEAPAELLASLAGHAPTYRPMATVAGPNLAVKRSTGIVMIVLGVIAILAVVGIVFAFMYHKKELDRAAAPPAPVTAQPLVNVAPEKPKPTAELPVAKPPRTPKPTTGAAPVEPPAFKAVVDPSMEITSLNISEPQTAAYSVSVYGTIANRNKDNALKSVRLTAYVAGRAVGVRDYPYIPAGGRFQFSVELSGLQSAEKSDVQLGVAVEKAPKDIQVWDLEVANAKKGQTDDGTEYSYGSLKNAFDVSIHNVKIYSDFFQDGIHVASAVGGLQGTESVQPGKAQTWRVTVPPQASNAAMNARVVAELFKLGGNPK